MIKWETIKVLLDRNKNEIKRFLFKTYTNDNYGYPLDETEYNDNGEIVCKRIYKYFDNREVKEYIEYDPNDELLEKHTYSKNEFGVIDRVEFEFINEQKTIKEYYFSDIGNAQKAIVKNEDGEITGYEIYVSNNEGLLIEEIELDEYESEITRYSKKYNDDGLLTNDLQFNDDELISEDFYEYNDKENVIKKTHKNYLDNYVVIDEYKYDLNGNMIYNCARQNDVLVFENLCTYNENNDLILEELFELSFWEKKIIKHERLIHKEVIK